MSRILERFKPKDERGVMLRNNILLSAILKVVGLLTSLLIVPVTLAYLNKEQYGIWMTMSSVLMWFSFFDIGLGNGMRNYLTEAISNSDYRKGRVYLTTTLVMLSGIALILGAVFIVLTLTLNLNDFFNTTAVAGVQLRHALLIAIVCTTVTFVVKNVGLVYVALQRYAINDLLIVSGNVVALAIIYVITRTTSSNLTYVVMAFTVTPVIVFLLAAIPLFHRFPQLRPSRKAFDLAFGKQIVSKGLGFFAIQVTSCLVIFGGSNFFITQFMGPEAVTPYSIAYRYFNLLAIGYTIIISPMWNAYTDASVKGEYEWIRKTFRRALLLWGGTVAVGTVMLLFAGMFYRLWVGSNVVIPFSLSVSVLLFISFFNLNNCVTYLINGLNKIRVQIVTSIVITALYIATVMLLGKHLGVEGVVCSMAFSYAAMSMIHLYQCRLLIRQKATGIWNQ